MFSTAGRNRHSPAQPRRSRPRQTLKLNSNASGDTTGRGRPFAAAPLRRSGQRRGHPLASDSAACRCTSAAVRHAWVSSSVLLFLSPARGSISILIATLHSAAPCGNTIVATPKFHITGSVHAPSTFNGKSTVAHPSHSLWGGQSDFLTNHSINPSSPSDSTSPRREPVIGIRLP